MHALTTFYQIRNSLHTWVKAGKNGKQYSTPVLIQVYLVQSFSFFYIFLRFWLGNLRFLHA